MKKFFRRIFFPTYTNGLVDYFRVEYSKEYETLTKNGYRINDDVVKSITGMK